MEPYFRSRSFARSHVISTGDESANVLVTLEALVELLGITRVTGLVLAWIARPTACVMFIRSAAKGIPLHPLP
ncbi:hypothetical protein H6F43_20955 [Leptolyngbya sp. FACHB-36]|uniref:hypothetical protein n=1 Tax=Leptolyngbya sp. FACHB-36 TaxID=2692808 RepID=UPI001681B32E|nr:hypothetical protein [Leptolyngbya sp. FACHB-36]MBD2022656.1 hypothetical protein [Leptolyngbya sp. FACHB-36]